jgi:clusterin-associated protein 1
LRNRLEKKREELANCQKRFKALKSVRPAYMDEYERIEAELVENYRVYMVKFRNLAYLEQLMDNHNAQEKVKADVVESKLKGIQRKIAEEELELIRKEKENIGYRDDVISLSGEVSSLFYEGTI